jgi:hypothetical protein
MARGLFLFDGRDYPGYEGPSDELSGISEQVTVSVVPIHHPAEQDVALLLPEGEGFPNLD